MKYRNVSTAAASLVALCASAAANASGFALVEQSAKEVGRAVSGGAAAAEDPTTIYFNPAGMSRLAGNQLVLSSHVVTPYFRFSGEATTNDALPIGGGSKIGGGDGGNAASTSVVPNFYWMRTVNQAFKFGLGVNAPFGLTTEYSPGWIGRYHAIKSELQTLDINPAVAFKINDRLSLGAGINAMYAKADFTNAIDYSAACLSVAGAACVGLGLATPGSPATDGGVKITGDGWGYGYNLGLLYQPSAKTRLGVAYRSMVKEDLTGSADFTAPGSAFVPPALAATLADTGATVKVHLPETLSVSAIRAMGAQWDLMTDLTWTGWSHFQDLMIKFDNPSNMGTDQPEHWDNTYKLSVGFDFRANEKWTLRGGVAYDQSPIPSVAVRTPRIPDNNRRWLAAGFTYRYSPELSVDVALAHLLLKKTPIDAIDANFANFLAGNYDSSVNTVSAQLDWRF